MSFHIIIPSRYASMRLPGKPLLDIAGQSMIERVYRQAKKTNALSVTVATDHPEIKKHLDDLSFDVVMTDPQHASGTDRLNEACELLNIDNDDIVVNVQGDEPFISPNVIQQVARLLNAPNKIMSTLATPIDSIEELQDPNAVKVVFNHKGQALYFSRAAVPFDRDDSMVDLSKHYFRHLGIYAYRRSFLKQFSLLEVSPLEKIEKLEQLRVLDNGYAIEVEVAIEVPAPGVDTQQDLEKAIQFVTKN